VNNPSNLSEIIELFKTTKVPSGEVLELNISQKQLDEIGYKSFIDLADSFFFKFLTPTKIDNNQIKLYFSKLNRETSFHLDKNSNEKYGVDSEFFKIDKLSNFSFLYHYKNALWHVGINDKKRILNLGVNKGDEFEVIQNMLSEDDFLAKEFVGVDYSSSVIKYAEHKFPHAKMKFYTHDINKLQELNLDKFDLLISIGTLQSSSLNFNESFMNLYQNYVADGGAIILGFPNCRWIDGEMIYGAKPKNYNHSELSLVLKDIHFCKKYLQQKKYRVRIIGKDYLFLVATKIAISL